PIVAEIAQSVQALPEIPGRLQSSYLSYNFDNPAQFPIALHPPMLNGGLLAIQRGKPPNPK
ncbi:MAG: hypothetical protein KDE54_39180, partial [Caldilineaceae bacterium]|nr:hypothetical protein [Caldilineaceae bacterium]